MWMFSVFASALEVKKMCLFFPDGFLLNYPGGANDSNFGESGKLSEMFDKSANVSNHP